MNTLFDLPPTRAADPASSHEAAARARYTASGHIALIVAALRTHPGSTTREMTQWVDLDRVEIARRMSDAERKGLVCRTGERKCSVAGTKATAWEVQR